MKQHSNLCTRKRTVIDKEKKNENSNQIKSVENINKIPQSFLGLYSVQKEFAHSLNLQDHAYV